MRKSVPGHRVGERENGRKQEQRGQPRKVGRKGGR